MQITTLARGFVAEIGQVDLGALDDAAFARLHDAWQDHPVLRVRGQTLDDAALRDFSRRFGPLEYAPHGRITAAERAELPNPYVATISNIVENGRPIGGLGAAEATWHTDMSYNEHPPTASVLYGVEVPPEGGDTHFCSMIQALSALPGDLAAKVRRLRLKHDAAHDSVGKLRRGHSEASDARAAPGATHPAVRSHPDNHSEALYLGRRQDAYVDGLPLAESEALLDEIWRYVALPGSIWTQRWQVGDVLVWDNRSVMHRRSAFPANSRRLMRRTQVRSVA